MVTLGDYIERVERINFDGTYGIDDVRGVANTKGFIKTKANLEGRNLTKFLIVHPEEFVFRECPAYTLLYQFSPKDTGQSKVK